MKKSILALGAVLATSISFGQITIGEWDVVGPGDQITQNSDSLPTITFPAAGTGMSWDMSGLNTHTQSTMEFGAPGWFTNGSYFPTATVAAVDAGGFEIYLQKDSQGLRAVGVAADIFGTGDKQIYIDPADEILRFPATYNDAYVTNSAQTMSFAGSEVGMPVDSVSNKTATEKHVNIDGWGSLTTPYGTFDVIRVNEVSYSTDSTWVKALGSWNLVDNSADTSYSVAFWSNDPGTKFPLAELSHDNNGMVYSVDWLNGAPAASLDENAVNSSVYPNPANNEVKVNLEGATNATFVLYDLNGKEVLSSVVSNTSSVNVSGIKDGLYVYKVISNDSELKAGKITIKH